LITRELEQGQLFGLPELLFFKPRSRAPYEQQLFGQQLQTPLGVAAGPHSQLSQNIITAWLTGCRFIELKTVQTLDELKISKPCIDMEDEGYNVEWSQELKVEESYREYLHAWILIHALHKRFGFAGETPGVIFNASVGYNLEGMLKENLQWFLNKIRDISKDKQSCIEVLRPLFPELEGLEIPDLMSNNITLSTMHGCPPDEIESICRYLLEEGFHTTVKLNPTLLGPEQVRGLLNQTLGFEDVEVPDEAFGHDLKYIDALPMLRRLQILAQQRDLDFGVKLSNTLEVRNHRDHFEEEMMYLSGRPLHAITVRLAATLDAEFQGNLPISFAGGVDAFRVASLLKSGVRSITVCSDLLKPGGYARTLQYFEEIDAAYKTAPSTQSYIIQSAAQMEGFLAAFPPQMAEAADMEEAPCLLLAEQLKAGILKPAALIRRWAQETGLFQVNRRVMQVERICASLNLAAYADSLPNEPLLQKERFHTTNSKSTRPLGLFDCIQAPCTEVCPVNQAVPEYMRAVREGRFEEALRIVRRENPIPSILSRICDRECQDRCVRTHFDDPLAIREIKRFIMDQEKEQLTPNRTRSRGIKVAIIGAGPCGFSVARELAPVGYDCVIFEQFEKPGGMVSGTIPEYRLPRRVLEQDLSILEKLKVELRYGRKAGRDFQLSDLRAQGFKYIIIATGAQVGRSLNIPGEEGEGVIDAISFLRQLRDGQAPDLGQRVAVVGAGDVAMDAARSLYRLGISEPMLIYRRSIKQMPADPEEIEGLLEEGIPVYELAQPKRLEREGGALKALICQKMTLGPRGTDGRRRPLPLEGEELRFKLDSLLLAVSQASILDFFGEIAPELSPRGTIKVQPESLETSLPGIFAGGDTAGAGPSSAVKASADGKRIAKHIRSREEGLATWLNANRTPQIPIQELLSRQAQRRFRGPPPQRSIEDRQHFKEVILSLSQEEAQAEAARCLDCDQLCSICTLVCPNRALFTYSLKPRLLSFPSLRYVDGDWREGEGIFLDLSQAPQVAVLADHCNECGNCGTFCPSAGRPYMDKPRIYYDEAAFLNEEEQAFRYLRADRRVEGRFAGETHSLRLEESLIYERPGLKVQLHPSAHNLLGAEGDLIQSTLSLESAVVMLTLLEGLEGSTLP